MVYGAIKLYGQGQTLRDSCNLFERIKKGAFAKLSQNNSFIMQFKDFLSIMQRNAFKNLT